MYLLKYIIISFLFVLLMGCQPDFLSLNNKSVTNTANEISETPIIALDWCIPGDINHDNIVDVSDLGILAANYGNTNANSEIGDINKDGIIDIGDLGILASNYGKDIGTYVIVLTIGREGRDFYVYNAGGGTLEADFLITCNTPDYEDAFVLTPTHVSSTGPNDRVKVTLSINPIYTRSQIMLALNSGFGIKRQVKNGKCL